MKKLVLYLLVLVAVIALYELCVCNLSKPTTRESLPNQSEAKTSDFPIKIVADISQDSYSIGMGDIGMTQYAINAHLTNTSKLPIKFKYIKAGFKNPSTGNGFSIKCLKAPKVGNQLNKTPKNNTGSITERESLYLIKPFATEDVNFDTDGWTDVIVNGLEKDDLPIVFFVIYDDNNTILCTYISNLPNLKDLPVKGNNNKKTWITFEKINPNQKPKINIDIQSI